MSRRFRRSVTSGCSSRTPTRATCTAAFTRAISWPPRWTLAATAALACAPLTVKMFGQERDFLTGTMQIALRCGTPIMQGFVVSRKNFYFRLILKGPLIDPATAQDTPETLQQVMQTYADNIADHIRHYPCHISKS